MSNDSLWNYKSLIKRIRDYTANDYSLLDFPPVPAKKKKWEEIWWAESAGADVCFHALALDIISQTCLSPARFLKRCVTRRQVLVMTDFEHRAAAYRR